MLRLSYLDPYTILSAISENFGYIAPVFLLFAILGSLLGFLITYLDDTRL